MSLFSWVGDAMGCGCRTRWSRQSCGGATGGVVMGSGGEMGEVESGEGYWINP